jgi:hypothetical protein
MHRSAISTNYPWLPHNIDTTKIHKVPTQYVDMPLAVLGDRTTFYQHIMQGCMEHYGEERCTQSEQNRMQKIRTQPMAMINYTTTGYTKIRTPTKIFRGLQEFWQHNRQSPITESWDIAPSYTYVVSGP